MRKGGPEETLLTQIRSGSTPWLPTEEACDYVEGKEEVLDFAVITLFGEQHLRRLYVIAEMQDRAQYGKGKREFNQLFTAAERELLKRWTNRIYSWVFRSGAPFGGVRMSLKTYHTLCRFADFFATLT